jgi:predicted transcriptional regulator
METIASSVRITADANRMLQDLSAKLGRSKAQIVEEALADLEDRIFWEAVNDAYAEEETPESKEEREIWDTTVGDGLSQEKW